jgi:hypothetical protein
MYGITNGLILIVVRFKFPKKDSLGLTVTASSSLANGSYLSFNAVGKTAKYPTASKYGKN